MRRRRENNKIERKYQNCGGGNKKKLRENIKILEEGIRDSGANIIKLWRRE